MAATYPSQVIAAQIAEYVKTSMGLATAIGADSNGNPTVSCGPMTTATQSAFVRIQPRNAALGYNIVGQAQPQYGRPHVIQFSMELQATGTGIAQTNYALMANILNIANDIGTRVEFYTHANGGAPAVADLAGTLVFALDDLYNPLTSGL
jgi:hypothetical protein